MRRPAPRPRRRSTSRRRERAPTPARSRSPRSLWRLRSRRPHSPRARTSPTPTSSSALAPDGSLLVTEHLTFDYDGTFQGSYRDIDLLHGEKIRDVRLRQGGTVYEPGGNTTLGSNDRPGVFGVERLGSTYRVVWHYRASDEQRTYDLSYRVIGGAVAYDDVIDVGWTVWGDQWDFDLDHLSASLDQPAARSRQPRLSRLGPPARRRRRDRARRRHRDARGRGRSERDGGRVPRDDAAHRGPGRVRRCASARATGCRRSSPKSRSSTTTTTRFGNRLKRFVEDNWLALILGLAALAALLHVPSD